MTAILAGNVSMSNLIVKSHISLNLVLEVSSLESMNIKLIKQDLGFSFRDPNLDSEQCFYRVQSL